MKKPAIILLLMIFILGCVPAYAFGPASTPTISGIDVSVYEGRIDFERVYASGVRMVYIRSSLGYSYRDPDHERNADSAASAGLEYGFYHFATASDEDEARSQARFFADTISGFDYDLRPVLELSPVRRLDRTEFSDVALAFLEELESRTGVVGAIYASADTARDYYDSRLAEYPLWVADYGVSEPRDNDVWRVWAGFQYTSTGRVEGIDGNVDLDRFTRELLVPRQTPMPSASPTISPTVTPTIAPTVTPTVTPTIAPTVTPTASPTICPTASPTPSPCP